MKIGFLLYPIDNINVMEDTSFWIMHELQRRGHQVFRFESRHMIWDGQPSAYLTPSRTHPRQGFIPAKRQTSPCALSKLDCIFIRKEPPFDDDYLHALQLLELVKHRVFVINDPAGIAMCNEKMFSLAFEPYIPQTLVTDNAATAKSFIRRLGKKVVLKRLNEKGGHGIFASHPKDENLPSLLETATRSGLEKIMVQRFIPARRHGDKRILILDGRIIGSFLRRPPTGDFRANIGVGGTFHRATVSSRDKKIVAALTPLLGRYGLHFAGIDIIGDYLTEINVTSPAGIADVIILEKKHLESQVVDFLEKKTG